MRNHVFASVLGTVIGMLLVLLVSPYLWWLGAIAGFAAAYLACDFREVLNAVAEQLPDRLEREQKSIRECIVWGKEPHPFLFAGLLAAAITWRFLSEHILFTVFLDDEHFEAMVYFMAISVSVIFPLGAMGFVAVVLWDLALVGGKRQGRYWNIDEQDAKIYEFAEDVTFEPISYRLVGSLILSGMIALVLGIIRFPRRAYRGCCRVVALIHSEKRITCGVDAAIAVGAVCIFYARWGSSGAGVAQGAVWLLAAASFGGCIGTLHYRFVDRWRKRQALS